MHQELAAAALDHPLREPDVIGVRVGARRACGTSPTDVAGRLQRGAQRLGVARVPRRPAVDEHGLVRRRARYALTCGIAARGAAAAAATPPAPARRRERARAGPPSYRVAARPLTAARARRAACCGRRASRTTSSARTIRPSSSRSNTSIASNSIGCPVLEPSREVDLDRHRRAGVDHAGRVVVVLGIAAAAPRGSRWRPPPGRAAAPMPGAISTPSGANSAPTSS